MLFTLTALKHYWRITFGTAKNKVLEQNRLFCTRMTSGQLLTVTDGALKLDHASVIFVDPRVQIVET